MTSATFRWRPGGFFVALPVLMPALLVGGFLLVKAPVVLLAVFLGLTVFSLTFSLLRTFRFRLRLDERGVSLLGGDRPYWTIPWSDLQEVTYQPGSLFARNWDRLVLRTPTGIKNLTLDDRLSGRWSDPEAIKELLRARGYAL